MKCFKQLGALALFFFAAGATAHEGHDHAEEATDTSPSDVHALKTGDFKDFIATHPLVLAEFYAPWCGHCKALAPEYEAAATKLKEKDIPLVKVDCTEEQDLCQEFGVSGYPTVKVFRGLESNTPYNGARKTDAIVSYMTKQALPAVSILDKDTITAFKTADKVVLIAYLDADDKEATEAYTKAATAQRENFLFGTTTDAALAKKEGVKIPAIVMYKAFDDPKIVYDGKLDAEEIEQFAKTASVPLIGEVGPDTYANYMASGIPLAYLFVADDESKTKLSAEIRPIAEKFKGKINFATIDAVAFGAHASNLNLEAGKWPAFAIQETHKNVKFPYDQDAEITEKAIAKFVQDYSEGKIEPSIKSEPIPEKQEGPVHVVVAHNYKDLVLESDKDVLLEYYAPWCGHCKNLAPKYEELAKLYFDNPEFASKVIVAKVDATANDVPDEIQGFPTIKLFPAGKKEAPVEYQGSRTVEDLANFIRDNGAYKIDAYVPPPPEPEEKEETPKEKTEEEVPKEKSKDEDIHEEL
ncbi:protein disulfide isomerase [Terfezia boudieri ATCC MYA-4762]|uniref:Protein disulfide-isomerase n=1 Tax=Terfezia boudieri ATCC MYA-4762 TaxID=1051890 RepID=A0A3N4M5H6_9PEZI|nr:protein disulfide isomerase [Terfezia boudieri ATCC MYA-4762]